MIKVHTIDVKNLIDLFIISRFMSLLLLINISVQANAKICSKLTIKTPERRQWRRSGVFIVDFEHRTYGNTRQILNQLKNHK